MKTKQNLITLMILLLSVSAVAQTGGTYDLSHNVIAGGGERGTGGGFTVDGTIGQPIAGTVSTGTSAANNQYSLRGGFWAFQSLAPTAAQVSLSGRVRNSKGAGIIRRVRVRLIDTFTGTERTVQTNPFGYYQFEELEVGHFYIIRAESNNFAFTPDSYAFSLLEDRENVDFTGYRIGLQ